MTTTPAHRTSRETPPANLHAPSTPQTTSGPTAAPAPLTHRQILVVFSGLMLGMLLAALDQTIVSTALPTIVGDLGGLEQLSWVVTAYMLTSTSSTPLFGKISDLYGRKRIFQSAIVVFLAGSVLAGLAQSMPQLIAFRAIQGIGAGGLMALAQAIIGDIVAPRERGRYVGYMGAVFAFSSIVGPLLGGFFVDALSWRWVFYINLPIGAVALVVTSIVLKLPVNKVARSVDYLGSALLVAAVSLLLLVSVWGGVRYPWVSAPIVGFGLLGLLLGVAFVVWERRAPEPVLPLRLFSEPVFTVSAILSVLVGTAMFGSIMFLPVYFQIVRGASASRSGMLMLPLIGGLMVTSIGSGRIITRTGRYKVWPIAGLATLSLGMLLMSQITATTPIPLVWVYMTLVGFGIGGVMQVLVLAVQNAAEARDLGVATSATSFFRSMGGAFGVAAAGAIFNAKLFAELADLLPGAVLSRLRATGEITGSPEAIRGLPPEVREAVVQAVSSSLQTVFVAVVPLAVAGFLIAWLLKERPLRDTVHAPMIEDVGEDLLVTFEPNVGEDDAPLLHRPDAPDLSANPTT